MDKFVADESVDFRLIKSLRESGFEVIAIIKDNPGLSDDEVLAFTYNKQAILITEDKDFGELTFRLRKPAFGIILLRFGKSPIDEKIPKLLSVLQKFGGKFTGMFTVIMNDKFRMKPLI